MISTKCLQSVCLVEGLTNLLENGLNKSMLQTYQYIDSKIENKSNRKVSFTLLTLVDLVTRTAFHIIRLLSNVLIVLIPFFYVLTNKEETMRAAIDHLHVPIPAMIGSIGTVFVNSVKALYQIGCIVFYENPSIRPLHVDFSDTNFRLNQVPPTE